MKTPIDLGASDMPEFANWVYLIVLLFLSAILISIAIENYTYKIRITKTKRTPSYSITITTDNLSLYCSGTREHIFDLQLRYAKAKADKTMLVINTGRVPICFDGADSSLCATVTLPCGIVYG
jgi:hypothetical protein